MADSEEKKSSFFRGDIRRALRLHEWRKATRQSKPEVKEEKVEEKASSFKGEVKKAIREHYTGKIATGIRESVPGLALILLAILADLVTFITTNLIVNIIALVFGVVLFGLPGALGALKFFSYRWIPYYTIAAVISLILGKRSETSGTQERKPFLQFSITSVIILIVIAALVAFNWQNIPSLLTKGEVAGQQLTAQAGVGRFFSNLRADIQEWITLQYGFKQPKVEEKQPSGLKIQEFAASRSYFEEGQPVVTRARIHIDPLPKDDASVKFSCESEGNEGEISITRAEASTIFLERGKARDASLLCEIKRGLNAGDGKPITRKVKLTGEYENFATKTALKIYTLDEKSYEEVGTQDPFDYFRIEEPLLSSNNIIKSQCVSGCGLTLLSLKVSAPQPLTQLGRYFLDINLQKDRDWYGEINKVNEIKVINIPESVSFKGCDKAIAVEGGQSGEASEINNLIKDKKDLTFSCEFEVINPDIELGDNIGQFIVEANYNYAVTSTTTVDIKPPSLQRTQSTPTGTSFVSDILQGESPFTEVLR